MSDKVKKVSWDNCCFFSFQDVYFFGIFYFKLKVKKCNVEKFFLKINLNVKILLNL
jgi:hypothetical protein